MSLHDVTLGFSIGAGIGLSVALPVALWQFAQAWVIEPLRARRLSTQKRQDEEER